MSNPLVREYAESLIRTMIPEAPFQDTIGRALETKNLPEVWSTVEFGTAGEQRLTIGRKALFRETNNFDVMVIGRAGFGADPLLRMLEKFRDFATDLQTRLTAPDGRTGTLRLDSVNPPNSEPYEDGNWLIASCVCIYTYDSVRGAVGQS